MAKLTILLCLALFAVFVYPVESQTLGGPQSASRAILDDLESKLIEVFRNYYIANPSWDGFGVKSVLHGNYKVVAGTIYDVNIEISGSKNGVVTEYEAHVTESLDGKIVKVCKYITNLNIKQMIPLKEELVKKSIYNPRYVYRNYPSEFCHHARLGVVLNELTNLTNLSLEYGLRKCQYNYKKRFFDISYEDIEDLASGMKALTKLKSIRFQHTRLNDEKLRILTLALVTLPLLETLELMDCNLIDNSGMATGHLLQNHSGLKSLNLKGNQIQAIGCQGIGYGLQQLREPLQFLGLSCCPIGTEGICRIGGALKGTVHCPKLDISFCSLGENGSMFIAELFSFHKHIVTLSRSTT